MNNKPVGTLGANHVRDRWIEVQRLPPEHKRSLTNYLLASVAIVLLLLVAFAISVEHQRRADGPTHFDRVQMDRILNAL
jgi:hypothetical protein